MELLLCNLNWLHDERKMFTKIILIATISCRIQIMRELLNYLFFYFLDKALWSPPAPEGCCPILWRACEFSYMYTAWCWSIWEICYVRWVLFHLCYLFSILVWKLWLKSSQEGRIASYGYGASSLASFFLKISSQIQFSLPCAIKHAKGVSTIYFWPFYFQFYKFPCFLSSATFRLWFYWLLTLKCYYLAV